MDMITVSDEWLASVEKRGPTPPNGWSFEIGQRVEHIRGGMPSTVVGRGASTKVSGEFARELAYVQLDETPEGTGDLRTIDANVLVLA
jgi:hypothetical protein